jgi:ribosomal protein S18 acetylase RimI-like enzyme
MATALRSAPLEIFDLRHFSSSELRPLLEREAERWAALLEWDYRGSAEMILRYLDAKILPGYAAIENDRVKGYSFFVYEGSKGVIGDLFVDTNGRGSAHAEDIERRLLRHVIETLQNSPGIHRIEAQLLTHESGQASAPFIAENFRPFARLFMHLTLAQARTPRALPGDVELRGWTEDSFQGAAGVITAAYRGHVDSEINDQYRSVSGSMRFLNNIVRFPGCGVFDGEGSFVAIDRLTRAPIGVILCSRIKDDVGHITQVCVAPEHRGRGIGEALIGATQSSLQRRRFRALSLTVTEANRGAVELYQRLNFVVKRVFDAFVWEG